MISFKGRHTPKSIILQCVRWYCSYSLSYRNIEEMMEERGIKVDHSTLNRWVIHYAPKLENAFHKKGSTINFLLTAKRDTKAALHFFNKAIGRNGKPGLINIDKSGANQAGIKTFNKDNHKRIVIRQCKYLNNIVEQDHRRVKRITRLMLGFKSFHSAQSTLAGIELFAILKKGQMKKNLVGSLSPAKQFYALAA